MDEKDIRKWVLKGWISTGIGLIGWVLVVNGLIDAGSHFETARCLSVIKNTIKTDN